MRSIISYINIRKLSRKKKIHFFINIIVGLLIAISFHFVEQTLWGEYLINISFDRIIASESAKAARTAKNLNETERNKQVSEQILFILIDQNTFTKLGEPLITPRNKIADIVETAYKGGASVIILDFLMEEDDCCNPEHDLKLLKVFQKMTDDKIPTKVIFPVRVSSQGAIKQHVFKKLIDQNDNFFLAIPNIAASATDRVIRYWVPYEITEDGNIRNIIWNVSLLATVIAHNKLDYLNDCEKRIAVSGLDYCSIDLIGGKDIDLTNNINDLYRYRIRYLLIPENAMDTYPGGNLFENVYSIDEMRHAELKSKIVLVGNSSPFAGDLHPTPAGQMAGIYIIGNAVNTITLGMQPAHSSKVINIFIEIIVILIAAYFFLYFTGLLAQIIVSILLMSTLGVVSYYYFFHSGVFLNSVFPVIGMGLHTIFTNIEDVIENRGIRQY